MIGIDELFDVRTTIWRSIVDEQTFVQMLDACYAIRASDRFDKFVPYSKYLEAYDKRDAATVRTSTVTTLIPVIAKLLDEALLKYDNSPLATKPTLFIHVPLRYEFSKEEMAHIQLATIEAIGLDVEIVMLREKVMSIKKLDELRVGSFFVYDVLAWLTEMASQHVIDVTQISPATTVITANVHTSDKPYNKEAQAKSNQTIFSEVKVAFNLEFFPAAFFTSPLLTALHLQTAHHK